MKRFQSGIPSSEITPEHVYLNRRKFMKLAGLSAAGALLAACGPDERPASNVPLREDESIPQAGPVESTTDELGDPLTSFDDITNYNNFYEFSLEKEFVALASRDFVTKPWQVEVGGLVGKPQTFDMEDIRKQFPSEERVYRLRCVEGWSMVIPWLGFPLAKLLEAVEPGSGAKYVAFQTAMLPEQMPGLKMAFYPWPYTEGLRLDEAMNDLALMVTGMYGNELLPQNGAPLRLAVPWKYGFKSIKSIVKIDLVAEMPRTLWSTIAPNEYGFYANVNPDVPHPRWSQASERRIGETSRRRTQMFNGYADQVAHLYDGMDLRMEY